MEWSEISKAGMHICGPAEAQLIDEWKRIDGKITFEIDFSALVFYFIVWLCVDEKNA